MAFAPRSMTGGQPLYGPRVNYTSSDAQRQQLLAQQLLREGASTRPAEGGIGEVLARIGTAGLGGYFSGQAQEKEDSYRAEKAKVLAQALTAGQGTPALAAPTLAGGEAAATRGTGVAQNGTPGDPQRMAAILMGNPQTADMGAQLALGQMQFAQQRAAQKEDTQAAQKFDLQKLYMSQDFQREMQGLQQAAAAGQQDKALAHAARLQQLQQAFQAGEGDKNRSASKEAAALNRVPDGWRMNAAGALEFIPGGPADPAYLGQKAAATAGSKITDEQAKAAGFADRIFNSMPIILENESANTLAQKGMAGVPVVGNYMVSPEFQKFDQARRDFVNAVLRRESGAVISKEEFENANKQYFPQPGDSQEVLVQKEKNRQEVLSGMARSAGPTYKMPEPKNKAGIPKSGDIVDGYKFKGGNPADPANWEKQ